MEPGPRRLRVLRAVALRGGVVDAVALLRLSVAALMAVVAVSVSGHMVNRFIWVRARSLPKGSRSVTGDAVRR